MTTTFIERCLDEFFHNEDYGVLKLSEAEAYRAEFLLKKILTEALLEGIKLADSVLPEPRTRRSYRTEGSEYKEGEHDGWNECLDETLSKIQLLKESVGV